MSWKSWRASTKLIVIFTGISALAGAAGVGYLVYQTHHTNWVTTIEHRPRVILSRPPALLEPLACDTEKGTFQTGKMQYWAKNIGDLTAEKVFLYGVRLKHAVQQDPELKRFYRRKLVQKGLGKAKVAAARKLGIRLYIMLRDQIDYKEFCRRGQLQQRGGARTGMPGQS